MRKSKEEVKKQNQVRYDLHKTIRRQGYQLVTRKRTIYVHYKCLDFSKQVLKLRDYFGYAIQTTL